MTKHKISTKSTVEVTIAVDAAHHPLTWKQEAFVNHYVATGNATEAYRRSYDCERMAPKSIETEALRLAMQHHPVRCLRAGGPVKRREFIVPLGGDRN
jgi:hypothetical protein